MNKAQCSAGHFSNSGFDLPSNPDPCELCPKNTFQNKVGQTSCENVLMELLPLLLDRHHCSTVDASIKSNQVDGGGVTLQD